MTDNEAKRILEKYKIKLTKQLIEAIKDAYYSGERQGELAGWGSSVNAEYQRHKN